MDAGPKHGQCLAAQAGDGRHHFTRDAAEVFDHYAGRTLIDLITSATARGCSMLGVE